MKNVYITFALCVLVFIIFAAAGCFTFYHQILADGIFKAGYVFFGIFEFLFGTAFLYFGCKVIRTSKG